MSDFCKQCGESLGLGNDMAGITSADEWEEGEGRAVLCEECGWTIVDPAGNCVTNCAHRHEPSVAGFDKRNALLGCWPERYKRDAK